MKEQDVFQLASECELFKIKSFVEMTKEEWELIFNFAQAVRAETLEEVLGQISNIPSSFEP